VLGELDFGEGVMTPGQAIELGKKIASGEATPDVSREMEMRASKSPWPNTMEELTATISGLVNQEHDYGTCVYAMSLSAVAAFNYVASQLGVTGFQASCADMDFIRRTRLIEHGFMLVRYENLLYPQYLNEVNFPSWVALINDEEIRPRLVESAAKLLSSRGDSGVHPDVLAHWNRIVSGEKF
jgi:hypothetical protein